MTEKPSGHPLHGTLTLESDLRLVYTLKNTSDEPQTLAYDSFFAPVMLTLSNKKGRKIEFQDQRVAMDHTGEREPPIILQPNDILTTLGFFRKQDNGKYRLDWELYIAQDLAPGTYEAQASTSDSKGTSEVIEVILP